MYGLSFRGLKVTRQELLIIIIMIMIIMYYRPKSSNKLITRSYPQAEIVKLDGVHSRVPDREISSYMEGTSSISYQ